MMIIMVLMPLIVLTLLCDYLSAPLLAQTLESAITRAFLCVILPARFRTIVASRPASTSSCPLPSP
jgi:hypothetical protein